MRLTRSLRRSRKPSSSYHFVT